MEIAGLAIGAAGLATLFTGCIDAFDHVRVARTQDSALRILSTKLENQKVRFIIWGQSLGLDDTDGYDPKLDHPIRRDSIQRTMKLVYDLFMEGECLQKRYGLRKEAEMTNAVAVYDSNVDQSVWKDFFKKIRVKVKKQKQKTPVSKPKAVESEGNTIRWMIADRNDFMELVTNLRELIDDLESMCKFADVHEYRRMRVTYEIESMGDTESLHLIRAASEDDDDDVMSIAASHRLDELEYPTDEEYKFGHKTQGTTIWVDNDQMDLSPPVTVAQKSRFYTPPTSVSQWHRESRSRERSRSPPTSEEDGLLIIGRKFRRARDSDRYAEQQMELSSPLGFTSSNTAGLPESSAIFGTETHMIKNSKETEHDADLALPTMGDAGPIRQYGPADVSAPSLKPQEEQNVQTQAPLIVAEEATSRHTGQQAAPPLRPGHYQRIAEQVREKRSTRTRRTRRFAAIQESDEESDERVSWTPEDDSSAYWVPQATPGGRLYYYNTRDGVGTAEEPMQGSTSDNNEATQQDKRAGNDATKASTEQNKWDELVRRAQLADDEEE